MNLLRTATISTALAAAMLTTASPAATCSCRHVTYHHRARRYVASWHRPIRYRYRRVYYRYGPYYPDYPAYYPMPAPVYYDPYPGFAFGFPGFGWHHGWHHWR
jgi:hypothetical protein